MSKTKDNPNKAKSPTKAGETGAGPRQAYRRTGVPPNMGDAAGTVPGKVTTPQRY